MAEGSRLARWNGGPEDRLAGVKRAFGKLLMATALVAGALGTASDSHAQLPLPGYPQPPEPVALNVPVVLQQTDVWCWLAASEMVIRYYNRGLSYQQCRILEIGYQLPPGACCGQPLACRTTGQWPQISAAIAFGNVRGQWTPPLDPQSLYAILQQGRPVLAQIRSSATSTHAVVIRGMRFQVVTVPDVYGRRVAQVMPFVLVNDPLSLFPGDVPYPSLASIWIDGLITGR
jgi:hypothetical protein